MVGTMLLLKMLHCQGAMKKGDTSSSNRVPNKNSHSLKRVKREKIATRKCRVCQKEGSIKIYGNNFTEAKIKALKIFCGIELSSDDPYPRFLCHSCDTLLEGAILLRKTALRTKKRLRASAEAAVGSSDFIDSIFDNRNRQMPHHCRQCNISFESYQEYENHRFSEEHENMRHTCPICHKSYKAIYFRKHLQSHEPGRASICDICGKNVFNQGHFTRHRLTHFYQLPFKCSLCPYRGRFSESLKMHMRSHTGERPYQCAECPSRFISKSNLNKHALRHRGDHDFKCENCGRGFYTRRELESHDRVEHRGIKEHICSVCGKAFGYRKQMMKHQLKVHKRAKLRSGRMPIYLQVETLKNQGQDVSIET